MTTSRFETPLRFLVTSIIGVAGCAHGVRPIDGSRLRETRQVYSSRYLITGPEISRAPTLTAYELVVRVRPEFLETNANRDAAGPVLPPTVYIDGLMTGDVSALRNMPTRLIAEIRFVPARDATTYHGQAHRTGDIMVYTHRARAVQPPF